MKWLGGRESSNVDDRRGISGGGLAIGGGVIGVIIYLVNMFLGGDTSQLPQLPDLQQQQSTEQMDPQAKAEDDERAKFVKVVLGYTEDVWETIFQEQGSQYQKPVLVLFRDRVESACGMASSASGPFYCPPDKQVYIDLSFYQELQTQFKAPGDFAMAYVIAHEVGHHIQNLMGTSEKMARMRQQMSETEYNKMSVKVELQADFYAGVWAHYIQKKNILEAGDVEEAMNAANAIGDDRLQRQSRGEVSPESFTHGTSAQRMEWFRKGLESGDITKGNTFTDRSLN